MHADISQYNDLSINEEVEKAIKRRKWSRIRDIVLPVVISLGVFGSFGLYYGNTLNIHSKVQNNVKPQNNLEQVLKNDEVKPEGVVELSEGLYYDASKSYITSDYSNDTDQEILARLIYGEARGQSDEEKAAVAYTTINRANDGKKWNGESIKGSALTPQQYSCFNSGDVNLAKLKDPMHDDPKAFKNCLKIAYEVLNTDKYSNLNQGQTNYFNPNFANPNWAKNMIYIDFNAQGCNFVQDFYIEK